MKNYLRPAVFDDAELLYRWRIEPSVRENSFQTELFSYENHQKWLFEILKKKNIYVYILMENKIPVGQIRIHENEKIGEISYSVDSYYRGKGYGKKLLKLVENAVAGKCDILRGEVKPENIPSCKAFEDMGYVWREEAGIFIYEKSIVAVK